MAELVEELKGIEEADEQKKGAVKINEPSEDGDQKQSVTKSLRIDTGEKQVPESIPPAKTAMDSSKPITS